MKRGFVVAVGGAALVIAGLSGCSSDNKSSSESTASETSAAASTSAAVTSAPPESSAAAESGATKVTIDGQDQAVQGSVVCATSGGNVNIAIGEGLTGIAAVVSEDGTSVSSVGLGNVNGVTLGFTQGMGGEATATKADKTYTISGTATGIDIANPTNQISKPFEITVTCP